MAGYAALQPSILAGAFQVFRQSRLDIRHKELPYAHGAARPALLVHIGNQRIERLAALAKLAVPRGQSAGSQLYDQVQCADPAVVDDGRTAIYDITAHTVYLRGGRRLEAHSGLGRLILATLTRTPLRSACPRAALGVALVLEGDQAL